jgi:hypothetical protein
MARMKHLLLFYLCCALVLSACSSSLTTAKELSIKTTAVPTRVVVRILNLDLAFTAFPPPTQIPPPITPEIITIQVATPLPIIVTENATPEPTPSCINRAEFVKHLTISDNAALEAGQTFTKMWRIKNIGSCIWTSDYSLAFYSGDEMGGPPSVALPNPVPPGETIDLRIPMTAPLNSVTATGNWVLKDDKGNIIGFGDAANKPLVVTIFVKPTPWPTPG